MGIQASRDGRVHLEGNRLFDKGFRIRLEFGDVGELFFGSGVIGRLGFSSISCLICLAKVLTIERALPT